VEGLEENFQASIFDFFRTRKGEALVVIGLFDKNKTRAAVTQGYSQIEIPPLRERKEDLPRLLAHYLEIYARKYAKKIIGFSAEALNLLTDYDYPGNYRELERLVEQGVLLAAAEFIGLRDLPAGVKELLEVSMKKINRKGPLGPGEARRTFERDLYKVLLSKTGGDVAATARFLDLPKSVLSERLEELGQNLLD